MTLPCHPFDIQYLICFLICSLFWYYCFFFKFWTTFDPNIWFSQLPLTFRQAHLCIHSVMESSLRAAPPLWQPLCMCTFSDYNPGHKAEKKAKPPQSRELCSCPNIRAVFSLGSQSTGKASLFCTFVWSYYCQRGRRSEQNLFKNRTKHRRLAP